jgi:hypothetical protein
MNRSRIWTSSLSTTVSSQVGQLLDDFDLGLQCDSIFAAFSPHTLSLNLSTMALNLEKQLQFVRTMPLRLHWLTCDTVWRIPSQCRTTTPTKLSPLLTCPKVNIGIHIVCVPIILLTAFLFVRSLCPPVGIGLLMLAVHKYTSAASGTSGMDRPVPASKPCANSMSGLLHPIYTT